MLRGRQLLVAAAGWLPSQRGVDSDALGAVVCLVDADQAVSKLKPEGKWVVSGRMVRNQRSDCEARMRGKYMLLRKEIMMN